MIVWQLDLQQPVPSVPITTDIMSLNPANGQVSSTILCDKVY
jgi:hypothetical protein